MPEREGFPAGVPAWIDTNQPDPAAAAAFYGELFGWQLEDRMPPDSQGEYLVATLEGRDVAAIGSPPRDSPQSPAWNTYITVENADAAAEKVRSAGGTVMAPPFDVFHAGRAAACADPAGATFNLWQAGTMKGAQAVNLPGSWNWSNLNTTEIETAERFYNDVFGWESDEVDLGGLSGRMLRRPGYADFLERFDPGLRKRHAEFGAPPGFSDCVGWIQPLRGGDPPHWGVTFAVADTDAIVDKARQLGGGVITEPLNVPPVRRAVLRDPQGAEFTINSFNPA